MKSKALRFFVFALLIAGLVLAVMYRDQIDVNVLEDWVKDAGMAGPVIFMLVYIIGTVFFLPGSVLTLAGGALFGPVLGTLYNLTAATIGAIVSFIAARYLAHDWVERKVGGRIKALKQGVEGEGWKFVAFVRLVPLFPFNLLNYALGLTRIKLSHYSVATYVCMFPGAVAYTYLGYVGREAMAGDEAIIQKAMLGIALLAIVSFLPSLIGRLRRGPRLSVNDLKEKLDNRKDVLLLDVRTAEDFIGEQSHITSATNVPLEELPSKLGSIDSYLEKPIAVICRTDRRSDKAAQLLAREGFADVHVVAGGMTDWINNDYPIAQGSN